jgi:hypothetical protein
MRHHLIYTAHELFIIKVVSSIITSAQTATSAVNVGESPKVIGVIASRNGSLFAVINEAHLADG